MTTLLYLSGPMTGIEDFNYPAFNEAAEKLRDMGFAVFNPAETFGGCQTLSRETYMTVDMAAVAVADVVVTLPGWEDSKGAQAEVKEANRLGIDVAPVAWFIRPVVVGLCGFARAGKDTVGEILVKEYGYTRVSFADPLKAVARDIGWSGKKDETGRELLQNLGVAVREHVGESTWVRAAMMKAIDILTNGGKVVITDVRFANEISEVRAMGGEIWTVARRGTGPANDHVSEHEWTGHAPDRVVPNNGTIEELREGIGKLMGTSDE